jgi:hypothetical protein
VLLHQRMHGVGQFQRVDVLALDHRQQHRRFAIQMTSSRAGEMPVATRASSPIGACAIGAGNRQFGEEVRIGVEPFHPHRVAATGHVGHPGRQAARLLGDGAGQRLQRNACLQRGGIEIDRKFATAHAVGPDPADAGQFFQLVARRLGQIADAAIGRCSPLTTTIAVGKKFDEVSSMTCGGRASFGKSAEAWRISRSSAASGVRSGP